MFSDLNLIILKGLLNMPSLSNLLLELLIGLMNLSGLSSQSSINDRRYPGDSKNHQDHNGNGSTSEQGDVLRTVQH